MRSRSRAVRGRITAIGAPEVRALAANPYFHGRSRQHIAQLGGDRLPLTVGHKSAVNIEAEHLCIRGDYEPEPVLIAGEYRALDSDGLIVGKPIGRIMG